MIASIWGWQGGDMRNDDRPAGRLSQRHGFPKNPKRKFILRIRASQRRLADDVNLHSKQILKVFDQHPMIHQAATRLKADDQVEIGVCGGVASGDGAKNPHV